MKIVFMGTPDFAVPSLKALVEAGHDICGVFTQPDKPKNRGMKLQPTPVKVYALTQNIPVFQPIKMRNGEALAILKELSPELIVVAAYGKILPVDILELPPKGCINIHSSLLPKYRGSAPINWAILNGEDETGVSIQYMAVGVDTGDVIAYSTTQISLEENAQQLYDRLARMGAELICPVVTAIEQGTAAATPQDHTQASHAPMLSKELSPIDWSKNAREIHNQVRGLYPWPAAVAEIDGIRCKIIRTALTVDTTGKAAGSFVQADKKGLKIACGNGEVLEILDLQPDGKKAMPAAAFLAGHPIKI